MRLSDVKHLNQGRIFERYALTDSLNFEIGTLACADLVNLESVKAVSEIENFPQKLYNSAPVLEARGKSLPNSCKKGFTLRFETPVCISERRYFNFGFNGRGPDNLLEITFLGENGESSRYPFSVSTERWNYLLADLSEFSFEKITGVRFEYSGFTQDEYPSYFQLSDLRFGRLLDFEFLRSGKEFFEPQEKLTAGTGFLRFDFEAGEFLTFPEFPNARYTVLNAKLAVTDTVRITLKSDAPRKIKLYAKTDRLRDFCDRFAEFEVAGGDLLRTYNVSLSALSFDQDERLLGIRLSPEGSGRIELRGVRFVQNTDKLHPEEKAFLAKVPKVRSPYAFSVPERVLDVKDFGAKGDGFTSDNEAVQRALDEAKRLGGGRVLLSGGDFVLAHVRIYSDTAVEICEGSRVFQSHRASDYPYGVQFEHDNLYKNCNWAHNFLVGNMPLFWAKDAERVKVCGKGSIVMMDSGNDREVVGFPYWPEHCGGIIHVLPLGFDGVSGLEISDISINRASSYHCFLNHCENVTVKDVKMFGVRCLSADGIGLCGSKKVFLHGNLLRTNDDGVTLCSMYADPRAGRWWTAHPGGDNCVCGVEVSHCWLNSACGGGGKAISFIPWGTDAEDLSKQEIRGISVHDCVLRGGHSVGAWPDSPYHGKQPFDNSETDDFSPVTGVTIERNVCHSPTTLECITATDVRADCGIYSAEFPVNGDFSLGLSNWCYSKNVTLGSNGSAGAYAGAGGILFEGLHAPKGERVYRLRVSGRGTAFLSAERPDETGKHNFLRLTETAFDGEAELELAHTFAEDFDVFVGILSEGGALIRLERLK